MSTKEKSALGEAIPAPEVSSGGASDPVSAVMQIRKKLLKVGSLALTNTELLGLVLTAYRNHEESPACAERLVTSFGSDGLHGLSVTQWVREAKLGFPNACRMAAVFELGRRAFASPPEEPRVGSPAEAYALVRDLAKAKKEHLVALYLDAQNRLIHRDTVSIGSLNTTRTHPREVMHPAIVHSALAFVLVHNHPSGSLDPSRDDVEFTRTMQRAGELMGISLYDHLIVSQRGFVSLKERGLL
jgi:DNA repair protein RadC